MIGKRQNKVKQEEVEQGVDILEVEDQITDTEVDPAQNEMNQNEVVSELTEGDAVEVKTDDTPDVTIESLSEQIEALKTSAADSMDKAIRAHAELDNVRKRATRDIENAHKYALDKFINELLPILDSMELGINAADNVEDVSSLREGMDLTMKMFCSSLEKSGVSPVDPQKGDKFNPDLHEAVTMQEVDDAESGTVVVTLQKGYELNGRLIRPAKVIVAK
ncbi:MAG: nucleotide exchange factor GrpE [Gammaproteobacteria bacterium]|nr:nucleotide exchange factor GrpE [Gammaproteobacteria bacterium]MCK5498712.1 nucleotide exchange factor GrpE [Gammaproteobacteria bacterium]